MNFVNVPGSNTGDVVNIDSTSNVGIPGKWVFQVNQAQVGGKMYHSGIIMYTGADLGFIEGEVVMIVTHKAHTKFYNVGGGALYIETDWWGCNHRNPPL